MAITIDFSKTPPAAGGGTSARVAPGVYAVDISDGKETAANSGGKPMVTLGFSIKDGEFKGQRLVERFTLMASASDSDIGQSRLHAVVVACGYPPQKLVQLDVQRQLVGKALQVIVYDKTEDARTDEKTGRTYAARTISAIGDFMPLRAGSPVRTMEPSSNGNGAAQALTPAPATQIIDQTPAPAPSLAADDPGEMAATLTTIAPNLDNDLKSDLSFN